MILEALAAGTVAADEWWQQVRMGDQHDDREGEGGRPVGAGPGSPQIQRKVNALVDGRKVCSLKEALEGESRREDARRLQDLQDAGPNHLRMSSLNPKLDIVIPEDE